jgi:hypothetical protein
MPGRLILPGRAQVAGSSVAAGVFRLALVFSVTPLSQSFESTTNTRGIRIRKKMAMQGLGSRSGSVK